MIKSHIVVFIRRCFLRARSWLKPTGLSLDALGGIIYTAKVGKEVNRWDGLGPRSLHFLVLNDHNFLTFLVYTFFTNKGANSL
jgi:hypothetical protein